MRIFCLLIFSALLLLGSEYCIRMWWASFLWFLPLWRIFLYEYRNAAWLTVGAHGVLWGGLVFSGHWGGLLFGFCRMARGAWITRCIIPFFVVAYQACLSGGWWILVCIVMRKIEHKEVRMFWCVAVTWLYVMCIYLLSMIPFGLDGGDPFFNPITTLLAYPSCLGLLPCIGSMGILLLMLASMGLMWSLIMHRLTVTVNISLIGCSLLWSFSWYRGISRISADFPSWFDNLVVIDRQFHASHMVYDTIMCIQELCTRALSLNPHTCCIIFPESSVYRVDCLSEGTALLEQHFKDAGVHVPVLLGGFRWDGPACRNSIWWYQRGRRIAVCDKRHVLPLSEMMPWIFSCAWLRNLYFGECASLHASSAPHEVWQITRELRGVIYICSELFCAYRPRDLYGKTLIIALCNDSWAPAAARGQMVRTARLRAIEWNRDILYITHSTCRYFTAAGLEKIRNFHDYHH